MEKVNILGVDVSAVNMATALSQVDTWIEQGRSEYVCFRDVHGVMAAQKDESLRRAHERSGMIAPDGMPLVWISHAWGYEQVGRVCGPDFMLEACKQSVDKGYRHFLYGGAPGVANMLSATLQDKYPGLHIVGSYCPPFRELTPAEDARAIKLITDSNANMVWVGLGSPKQEKWMADHVDRIGGAVLFGVGAAFDFHAGTVDRAPAWMQRSGLEWLYRLLSEPRRLWRRYIVMAPNFIVQILLQHVRRGKQPRAL